MKVPKEIRLRKGKRANMENLKSNWITRVYALSQKMILIMKRKKVINIFLVIRVLNLNCGKRV
jgi:hypothetical protein